MDNITVPPFEDGGLWQNPLAVGEGWRHFRVGTCGGLYRDREGAYEILAIFNDKPGNKHVEAAFAHFYASCKRDKRDFIVREVMNEGLATKLARMGFTCLVNDDYIRRFK